MVHAHHCVTVTTHIFRAFSCSQPRLCPHPTKLPAPAPRPSVPVSLPSLGPHRSGITQHLSIRVRLTSLTITSLRFTNGFLKAKTGSNLTDPLTEPIAYFRRSREKKAKGQRGLGGSVPFGHLFWGWGQPHSLQRLWGGCRGERLNRERMRTLGTCDGQVAARGHLQHCFVITAAWSQAAAPPRLSLGGRPPLKWPHPEMPPSGLPLGCAVTAPRPICPSSH